MSDLFFLSQAQMRRIVRYFPLSHGVARVDDRRIVGAIVFVIKNGLRWRDAPREYGPHKTIYNRFVRWSRLGVFNKIFAALAHRGRNPERLMIDATHLKARRTAASLLKTYGPPRSQEALSRLAADPVCFNVSALLPAKMEIRAVTASSAVF
jgi:putative transposase